MQIDSYARWTTAPARSRLAQIEPSLLVSWVVLDYAEQRRLVPAGLLAGAAGWPPGGRTTTQRLARPSLVINAESSANSKPSGPVKNSIAWSEPAARQNPEPRIENSTPQAVAPASRGRSDAHGVRLAAAGYCAQHRSAPDNRPAPSRHPTARQIEPVARLVQRWAGAVSEVAVHDVQADFAVIGVVEGSGRGADYGEAE